jgi:hypothetical protein
MSRNDRLVRLWGQATGNLDTIGTGVTTGGPTLLMDFVEKGTLSARCVVDIETSTFTMAAKWQVSADASTWEDVAPVNNAANVVLGTGSGGADAAITKHIDAPLAVYGARYARIALVAGGTTGAAVDTYDLSYSFARDDLM